MMPSVTRGIMRRRGVAAVRKRALPIGLALKVGAVAAAAFGRVDRSTSRDLRRIVGISWGGTIRTENENDDPNDSNRKCHHHRKDADKRIVSPDCPSAGNSAARSPLLLHCSPPGHSIASSVSASDPKDRCPVDYEREARIVTSLASREWRFGLIVEGRGRLISIASMLSVPLSASGRPTATDHQSHHPAGCAPAGIPAGPPAEVPAGMGSMIKLTTEYLGSPPPREFYPDLPLLFTMT